MSNVPDGAQLSEDGQWWWDGSAWQPVEGAAGSSSSGAPPAGSESGQPAEAQASPGQWSENPDEWTEEQRQMFFTVNDRTQPPEALEADAGEPQEISEDIA